ncbi:MAG: peptide-methionine (S)-S-oxide reductase MsrA [Dokdonella sp.]|uniref:peptide-methionine (S)-S-oxide reductase MsrA n=1 Tax=Dokdonella sp. TaxID=2291710 RepID=UPI0025C6D9DD|nr:peptide-methionine (S)-S-oxide reductase MsrA [Dokdonella sp.]MBX3701987.1 peptide-methionine (S)-S-oxide reductase MsrA [Dokdonella sp.]
MNNPSCDLPAARHAPLPAATYDPPPAAADEVRAVLAGGCFWCVEAVFRELDGVLAVRPGYCGGSAASANYEAVCSGRTEHAEAVEIRYDPRRISYGQLLRVFFSAAHDPTQVDRQGNDRGRQYRSAIFAADASQRDVARRYIAQLDAARVFASPIATRIETLQAFHLAEREHQDYAARHPQQPYITLVAAPKVAKLRAQFGSWLKPAPGDRDPASEPAPTAQRADSSQPGHRS